MKKFFSIILCIGLILSALSLSAFAAGEADVASVTYNGVTNGYTDLTQAFTQANSMDGCEVDLLCDVDLGSLTARVEDGNFTFDLNGYTVSGSSLYAVIGIKFDSKLTVIDSVGGGCIVDTGSTAIAVYGELVLESGCISSSMYGVMVIDGKVTVNGGSIDSLSKGIVIAGDLIINGGDISGATKGIELINDTTHYSGASCCISGGTVNGGILIDNNYSSVPVYISDIFAENYYLYDENGNPAVIEYGQSEFLSDVFISEEECVAGVLGVEYEPSAYAHNTLKIKVNGRAIKLQLVDKNNRSLTRTYIRPTVDNIVSYNENGEEVSSLSREIAYEVWTITKYFDPATYYVRAKYNNGWEALFTSFSFDYTLSSHRNEIYSVTLSDTVPVAGESVGITVETGVDVLKIQVIVNGEHIATYSNPQLIENKAIFEVLAKCYNKGENTVDFRIKTARGWLDAETETIIIKAE